MKKSIALTMVALACLAANVQAAEKLAGNEILAVQKGGVPDKVYTQHQPKLRIATYNIGKNEASDNVADFTALNSAIKKINADIIAVPEVDHKTQRSQKIDQLKTIADANNMHYAFGKALDFDGGEYGLGLLSKYIILHSQVVKLPSGNAEQRVALLAQVDVPGFDSAPIIMVTHLDWQKDPTMRTEQARYLLDLSIGDAASDFKDIASSIKILAGDFNSTREEQPVKEIGYFFNEVSKQGTDTRSWPAVNPAIDIDHIFTFKGQKWDVKKLEIPHNSPEFNWSAASDHLPVIAELQLTEQ
ncbi:endonuclease/exonuclease/phosphatase family protein [Klebsiella aerogenes]|uniref:endonuclease/exonuclease/phosphatase family protein n=1 Tax=Klebsiella aerogenes TaxID=548 RepID=UPI003A97680D